MKKILFVQGLGMTKHEYNNSFDEIADQLKKVGFQTIQFDLPIFDEGGRCRELPLKKRAKFVQNIALQYKPDGLIAQSYGGATCLIAQLSTIKSRLLISPALDLKNSITRVYEEKGVIVNYSGDTTLPRSSGENTTVSKDFWEDIKDFDDIRIARNIKVPTCILHGSDDTKIPASTVQSFFNEIPVQQKRLKIYKGGDHGIVDVPRPTREEFLKDIIDWFSQTL